MPLKNYNILDYLEKVSDSGKESADEIREAVKNRSTGVTIYTKDRKKEYLCYNPLDDTGWTILLFVGGDTIGENMNRFPECVLRLRIYCSAPYFYLRNNLCADEPGCQQEERRGRI